MTRDRFPITVVLSLPDWQVYEKIPNLACNKI
jgi:hypothetical protein